MFAPVLVMRAFVLNAAMLGSESVFVCMSFVNGIALVCVALHACVVFAPVRLCVPFCSML